MAAYVTLIVEERAKEQQPPFEYAEDHVMVLTDIFYRNDSDIVKGLMGDPFLWSGETFNFALNGHSRTPNATSLQESTSCSYGVITVKPSTTYRFRFIGGMALSHVFVGFECQKLWPSLKLTDITFHQSIWIILKSASNVKKTAETLMGIFALILSIIGMM